MTRISSPERLAALRRTALLDTPPEAAFDRLTALAASVLRAPVALLSLVDDQRQFFKSAVGLPEPLATIRETPLSHAICALTVELARPLFIPDTRADRRVQHNGAVIKLGMVAYAGVPLTTGDGHVLGTLCVMDRTPREWTPHEMEALRTLAASISTEIALRHQIEQHAGTAEALRESESHFRGAFAHASIGMALTTFDGRFQLVNPALCRTLGYSEEELLARTFQEISHPDELPYTLELLDELLAGTRDSYHVEKRYFHKEGHTVWVRVDVTLSRSADGRPRRLIAQMQDISESRRAEEQLRQAQKMEAVGQLAGGVAHDFNNLLTVIKAHAQLALERLPPDEPVRESLDAVSDAAGRAADLTQRLLAFSRKQILQPQVLDLNAAVAGVIPMLERLIGEDIEVVTQLEPELGSVAADPAQLEQVLMNLAVNARDAMPHGGVLRVATANVDASEAYIAHHGATMEPGSYVMLEVSDTGCGMDAATQSHIFEPFFTTKEQGRGTGLGLAMVYGTVNQSGGYVRVQSYPGKGTCFQIWLPRVEASAVEVTRFRAPACVRGGSETVLLVEDEDAVRNVVQRILERQGYVVHVAPNGAEALRLAREQEGRIDLLLTDVVLPEMSGPAVAEQLLAEWPLTKVLFMSGYTPDEVARRGLLEPGAVLLRKPFTLENMARTVRGVLDQPANV